MGPVTRPGNGDSELARLVQDGSPLSLTGQTAAGGSAAFSSGAPAPHEERVEDDDDDEDTHHHNETWKQRLQRSRALVAGTVLVLLTVLLVATIAPAAHRHKQREQAQRYPVDAELEGGLGPVWWPASKPAGEQANRHFRLGLLLLHVFWFDQAQREFRAAIDTNPNWAMGYWGLAMASKQQLWQTEEDQTARWALDAMDEHDAEQEASARELDYVHAVKLMWAENRTREHRERAYSSAMESVYRKHPNDPDACAFYALSLLSMVASSEGYLSHDEAEQTMAEARQVLGQCTARWPDHAGLLHYTTHAYDEPDAQVASQGLAAGERLAEVATASCHALHMKSHLFLQLGNWTQVVDSNWRATLASDHFCSKWHASNRSAELACDADDRYHALEWWMYGLTQECGFADAKALLGRIMVVWTALNATPFDQWALRMWAHAVIQSQASPDLLTPLAAPLPLGSPLTTPRAALQAVADAASPARRPLDPRAADLYWELHARASAVVAAGYALTLHTNSTALAGDAGAGAAGPAAAGAAPGLPVQMMHAQLQSTLAEIDAQVPSSMPYLQLQVQLHAKQLAALQVVSACVAAGAARGCQGWQRAMDDALDLERRIQGQGPSLNVAPAYETYGHLLLLTGQQPARAAELFSECLAALRRRQSCTLGMARAAALAGNATLAAEWYARLWQQCAPQAAPADFLWPGLVEAFFMLAAPGNRSAGELVPPPPDAVRAMLGAGGVPRAFVFSYGPGLFTYLAPGVDDAFVAPAALTQAFMAARPPPFPPPADLDPVNRARLTQPSPSAPWPPYAYPFANTLMQAPVAGYPAGRVVVLNAASSSSSSLLGGAAGGGAAYAFALQPSSGNAPSSGDYWPPPDVLFTSALRVAQGGGQPPFPWSGGGGRRRAEQRRLGQEWWSGGVRVMRVGPAEPQGAPGRGEGAAGESGAQVRAGGELRRRQSRQHQHQHHRRLG